MRMRCALKVCGRWQLALTLIALGACGGGDNKKPQSPDGAATAPAIKAEIPTTTLRDPDWPSKQPAPTKAEKTPAIPVAAGELRFMEDGKLRMVLKADGSLILSFENGSLAGRLSKDNVFKGKDGVVIHLDNDGYIVVDGEESSYWIGKDGALRGAKINRIGIAADGTVTGQSARARPLRVEGATTAALKRRALLAFAILLIR